MTWRRASALGGVNLVDTYANRPASGNAIGQRFVASDGGPAFIWDGALWRPEYETTLGYEPPSTGWTSLDAGLGAAVSADRGVVELTATNLSSSHANSLAVRSFSGSGDFDVQVRIRQVLNLRNSGGGTATFISGLCLRDSATSNYTFFIVQAQSNKTKQIQVTRFNSQTSFNSDVIIQDVTQFRDDSSLWLRVTNVGTTRRFYVSNEGLRWWEISNESGPSRYPVSPDQAGLAHQGYVGSGTPSWDSGVRLESWRIT